MKILVDPLSQISLMRQHVPERRIDINLFENTCFDGNYKIIRLGRVLGKAITQTMFSRHVALILDVTTA